jgi:hypothetical protein
MEIWVVDNASTDGTAEAVRDLDLDASLVELPENRGFAAGANIGADRASGDYLLFLNPDAELCPGALPSMRSHLAKHPEVAMVGPQLYYPDGRLQDSAFTYPTLLMTWLEFFPRPGRLLHGRWNGRLSARDGQAISVDHPLGACMLISRPAWEDVGPFDEDFFMYCEEVDWCVRARRRGWDIRHLPSARVVHHGGRSSAQAIADSLAHLYASRARLHLKHRGRVYASAARFLTRLGLEREAGRLGRRSPRSPDEDARLSGLQRALGRL